MGRMRLILGTHNHLPLGRSEPAAERLYQESLKPFLAVLYRYPTFPVTLHYSGTLMEWLEESHPEFLALLGEMVGRGQSQVIVAKLSARAQERHALFGRSGGGSSRPPRRGDEEPPRAPPGDPRRNAR